MQEKQLTPMQNVQRAKAELRDKYPRLNVITHSGMATGGPGEKTTIEPLIRPAVRKQERLDLKKEKETFVTACKDFAEVEASTSQQPEDFKVDEEVEPFLQACMKLLYNPKAMEHLQALIDSCAT